MEINGTSPPLFREPLVARDPLTMTESWQRWLSAFWQQVQTTAGNAPGPAPWQPLDATLTAFAALTGTPNTLPYFTATESMALTSLSAYSRSLLALGDAASWRSTLGLGTMSLQNATAVAITGGTATLSSLLVFGLATAGNLQVLNRAGNDVFALYSDVMATPGSNRWGVVHVGTAPSQLGGPLYVAGAVSFGDPVTTRSNLGLGAVAIQPYSDTTFTITATGFSTAVTGAVRYILIGKQVTLHLPVLTGTSNATTFTLTGIPPALQPGSPSGFVSVPRLADGSAGESGGFLTVAGTTFTVNRPGFAAWAASGTKTLYNTWITYLVA